MTTPTRPLSLSGMLNPDVIANPYPSYTRRRQESPVLLDPFLHTWVITRYDDVAQGLAKFRAERTATPERLKTLPIRWQA